MSRPPRAGPDVDLLRQRVTELEEAARERDQLVAALAHAESQFRSVLAGLHDVVYSMSADAGTVHYISDACQELYHRPVEEFFRSPSLWREVIHPEDLPRVDAGFARLLGGTPFDQEYRIRRPDGAVRWVHDCTTLVKDAAGQPIRLNGIVSDITDQRLAQEAVARTEELLRLAMAAARAGAWEWDASTEEVRWSPGNYELLGYAQGSVVPSYDAWLAAVHPDDRVLAEAAVAKAMAERGNLNLLFRVTWPDGSVHWVNDVGRMLLDAEGRPRGMYGIQVDVTEQTERARAVAEVRELLQAFMDSTPDWLFAKDLDHRFLFVNRSFAAAQGLTPQDMIGRPDTEFWGLDRCEPQPATGHRGVHADDRRAFAGEVVHNPHEEATRADGSIAVFDTLKSPLRAEDGRITGVLCYSRDVTERERADAALRESEQRFRTLVGNIPGAAYRCEIRPPYRDLYVSDGILGITGFPASAYLADAGPRFGALTVEADRPQVTAAVDAAVAGRTTFEVRYRIRRADGGIRWVSEQGRATYAEDGTPLWLDGVLFDVTDEVSTERDLREREERLRTIVENEPECVKLLDRDGNLLEMNPAGLRMLEADSLEQILGRSVRSLVVPADQPAFREMTEAVFRGETRTLVFEVTGLRGGRRVLETHSVPLWDSPERHQVRSLLGVTRDITARRQAERALAESEERYRTLVASVPGAVYLCQVNSPWRDTFMSQGVQAITGHGPEAFLREDGLTFSAITLAEDLPRVVAEVEAALAGRQPYASRYRIRHADGAIRWVHDQGRAAYDDEGRPLFLTGVIFDITDRMIAEEAVRESRSRLVEAQRVARIGSWELDLRSGSLNWSEEIYRIFELDPERFGATYEAFLATVHPDDRALVDRTYSEALKQRTPYDLVHRLLLPDGRVKYVHERAETHYGADGLPIRSLGTVQDITERRQAEHVRQALEAQLRQAQKMEAIGTLAGGIAHDFNNILAAIIGHAELLAQDLPADPQLREGVAGILSASQRARDLVQQILTFSRRREQQRRPMALQPVVLEALRLLRATLPTTIEIRTEIATDQAVVLADPTQIHQVVVNLCTNGAHAMRARGGVLSVSYGRMEVDQHFASAHAGLRPGPYVRMTVSDTGHGMDGVTLERIFDPFFTTKATGEGTGLGLAVVHGIMQNHEGLVTVESQPGRGSLFNLYFPAAGGGMPVEETREGPLPGGRGEHILVVDDEPAVVEVASRLLTRLGYRVTGHTSPARAMAELRRDPAAFDLVLCDLTMPELTGTELAGQLRTLRPELPVVLTSGYSGSLDQDELQALGIRELLSKPFLLQALAETIRRNLTSAA